MSHLLELEHQKPVESRHDFDEAVAMMRFMPYFSPLCYSLLQKPWSDKTVLGVGFSDQGNDLWYITAFFPGWKHSKKLPTDMVLTTGFSSKGKLAGFTYRLVQCGEWQAATAPIVFASAMVGRGVASDSVTINNWACARLLADGVFSGSFTEIITAVEDENAEVGANLANLVEATKIESAAREIVASDRQRWGGVYQYVIRKIVAQDVDLLFHQTEIRDLQPVTRDVLTDRLQGSVGGCEHKPGISGLMPSLLQKNLNDYRAYLECQKITNASFRELWQQTAGNSLRSLPPREYEEPSKSWLSRLGKVLLGL